MSTLVFHQAALGDWIIAFPILRALPKPLTVVAAAEKAQLAERVLGDLTPAGSETLPWHRLYQADLPQQDAKPLAPLLRQASLVVSYVSGGADAWAHNVRRLSPGARLLFVQGRPPEDFAGHVLDWHIAQLAQQGLSLQPLQPLPRSNPRGEVIVHPGSGGQAKCWPLPRLAALVELLCRQGLPARPVLGEVELDMWPQAELDRWCRQWQARFCPNLEALHDLLAGARLFVGNDSGPTHLAAQMGLPTLALFGPTDPRRWAPAGPQVRVLAPPHPQPMDWLDEQIVLRHVLEMLSR